MDRYQTMYRPMNRNRSNAAACGPSSCKGEPVGQMECGQERQTVEHDIPKEWFHRPLAMCYVPWQVWKKTYDMERGLCAGTIFPELDLPFEGGRCSL